MPTTRSIKKRKLTYSLTFLTYVRTHARTYHALHEEEAVPRAQADEEAPDALDPHAHLVRLRVRGQVRVKVRVRVRLRFGVRGWG